MQRVRDKSENGMAVVASVRALEGLAEEERRSNPHQQLPGLTIVIQTPAAAPIPTDGVTIEVDPGPIVGAREPLSKPDPIFRP